MLTDQRRPRLRRRPWPAPAGIALTLLAGLPGLAAADDAPAAVEQHTRMLLQSAPQGRTRQGFDVGVTRIFSAAVSEGVKAAPAVANAPAPNLTAADRQRLALEAAARGMPRITGFDLPANFAELPRKQNEKARSILGQLKATNRGIRVASEIVAPDAEVGMLGSPITDGATPNPGATWFDWRNLNMVTTAKNQGTCGCCWAFASAAAYESSYAIRNRGALIDASEQYLLNCNSLGFTCNGGLWPYDMFQNAPGVMKETDDPYSKPPAQGGCLDPGNGPYRAKVWGYVSDRPGIPTVAELKQALCEHGPLTVGFYSTVEFSQYTGGVFSQYASGFTDPRNPANPQANHAIVVVGWDDAQIEPRDPNKTVWAIKNSWDTTWGVDGGFAWVRSDTNNIGVAASWVEAAAAGEALASPAMLGSSGPAAGPRSVPPVPFPAPEPAPDQPQELRPLPASDAAPVPVRPSEPPLERAPAPPPATPASPPPATPAAAPPPTRPST